MDRPTKDYEGNSTTVLAHVFLINQKKAIREDRADRRDDKKEGSPATPSPGDKISKSRPPSTKAIRCSEKTASEGGKK